MTETEKALVALLRRDEKWENIFAFIVELENESPRRAKLLSNLFDELIDFAKSLDEDESAN
ncbi:hypothetical protein [Rossellomorea aquimaris]|uniref:hypothetical protein n=1 Tax=Rossellomorea aquimaris TaxID=189382 RepID=UPI0007D0A18B|nr:hypothetical protein [Rossellomorea aquimaris]